MPDEQEEIDPVEMAGQADMLHNQLNGIKETALGSAAELEQAAYHAEDDERADELREAAAKLRRVYQRIEHGDRTMVRNDA